MKSGNSYRQETTRFCLMMPWSSHMKIPVKSQSMPTTWPVLSSVHMHIMGASWQDSFKLALPALKTHPLFAYMLLGLDMLADTCRNIWKFRHIHEIFSNFPVLPLGRESKCRNMRMTIIDTHIKTHDVGQVVGKVVLDFSVPSYDKV